MSDRPPYINHMSMLWELKGVPYGGSGKLRDDGAANYGFQDLKGKPELLPSVPELVRDRPLMDLVAAINDERTGLFTLGCVSGEVADSQGFRYTGYVELCINSASAIEDARSYFPLWFHFDECLHQSGFKVRVMFDWELQPATFYVPTERPALLVPFSSTHTTRCQRTKLKQIGLNLLQFWRNTSPACHHRARISYTGRGLSACC